MHLSRTRPTVTPSTHFDAWELSVHSQPRERELRLPGLCQGVQGKAHPSTLGPVALWIHHCLGLFEPLLCDLQAVTG